jgi:hypothetical protein
MLVTQDLPILTFKLPVIWSPIMPAGTILMPTLL